MNTLIPQGNESTSVTDTVGEDKVGRIECIVCGEFKWYLNTQHHETHPVDKPQYHEEYLDYVGETFDLGVDHELLADDTVINPNKWIQKKDEYPEVKIRLELK